MTEENTVPCRFWVICGKFTDDGSLRTFTYDVQAPASLCVPHLDNGPKPSDHANGVFMASLVERHHLEILYSQAWRCVTCDNPATELLHCTISMLSPVADRADFSMFFPTVIDNCAPICNSGGACDRAAKKMADDFAKSALIQKPWQVWVDSKTCDNCGKKSGVKVCGGCKFIAYCSKECQAQRWPEHKRNCKRAQREARKNA